MGIYLLWLEKQKLSKNTTDLKYQFLNFQDNVQSELDITKQQYEKLKKENEKLKKELKEYEDKIQNKQNQEKIKVVIPKSQPDFSTIIKKDNNNIMYDENLSLEKDEDNKEDLKITPEVLINKDDKKIDGLKLNVETKFDTGN